MPFDIPTETFNATEWAKNKILRLNQFEESVIRGFISNFEAFWEVSGQEEQKTVDGQLTTVFVGNGSRHTVGEMQKILDIIGIQGFIAIKTASDAMIAYIESQGGIIPDRYKKSPFDYEITQNGVKLTKLADVWVKPPVETEE